MVTQNLYIRCCAAQEHADNAKEAVLAAPESDEGLMLEQPEVTTPGPTKEPRPVQDADGSPEVRHRRTMPRHLQLLVWPHAERSTVCAGLCATPRAA